jgi:glutamate carboxypeptidase
MKDSPFPMREALRHLRAQEDAMVRLLGKFVRCESPSLDKRAVDSMGELFADEWRRRGARIQVLRQKSRGNHVRAEIWLGDGRSVGQLLVLGHLDTVYGLGTISKMPFRISGGRAWGPGTFDMKGGLVQALFAVDVLRVLKVQPRKRLVFLWNSDEEIGSGSSRHAIEREARRSDAVFVLEPAFGPKGHLKTSRKGVGTAEIIVTGRSAHAGIDPKSGVNAVHELAMQIMQLAELNNPKRGIALQSTVVAGGTVSNVIPDRARVEVDVRYSRLSDAKAINRKLHSIKPILRGAQVEIRGGVNRPPLERTTAVRALFARAQSLMRETGLSLGEISTGGGSDGNLTAALGVPTLDGMGAVGDGAHSPREHVIVRRLSERAALLAGLLATL